MKCRFRFVDVATILTAMNMASSAMAQETKQRPPSRPPTPPVISPEVKENRTVTVRLRAASANAVRLDSSDIPNLGPAGTMKKSDDGIWEVTVGPLVPGAYRYNFNVDGVRVLDPANPVTSESNSNTSTLVIVPGSELFDTKDVPHGAVAEVTYQSQSLKRARRMHVYTPPGYGSGEGKFPVFYLLHGASDSDASWSTVGRAGFILDNLIASGKAKPMIVVMPNGHVGRFGQPNAMNRQIDEFGEDFVKDLKPYIEKNYRTLANRENRAIAGLSMGGAQTLNIAIPHLEEYAYVGVYSSGVFGINGRRGAPATGPSWEERHKAELSNAETKKGLDLIWFATGKDDFLIDTTRDTVKMLKNNGFNVVFNETAGGHTWLNWRDYLTEFVPLLFKK